MRLTVLNVAYPFAPVGPDATGGAEQVLTAIDAALPDAGHRSVVVACEGSQTRGDLLSVPVTCGAIDDLARGRAHAAYQRAIELALRRWPVDVIHLHGIDFDAYLPPPGPPVLVTLHLPIDWYSAIGLRTSRPRTWFNCVSATQHREATGVANLLEPIANGVPIEAFQIRHAKRRFGLVLARICPEKGIHLALNAAKHAGLPLLVAGEIFNYPEHRRYFDEEVRPRLDRWRRYLGPVGFRRKRRLIGAAQFLVVPSLVAETGSLVACEALAAGTPVVAMARGVLPDLVQQGHTGFLVHDETDMAAAMQAAPRIDPELCRQTARDRFSLDRMIAGYVADYQRLVLDRRAVAVSA